MSIVISSDKHYKDIASKIRTTLGNETEYKPSEMADAILSMKNMAAEFTNIKNGFVFANNGETVKIIGDKMYRGMFAGSNIKSFTVPENITELLPYTFCNSKLENITMHDNITAIDGYCFYGCKLKSITLPKNLTDIFSYAFALVYLKDNLIIPNTVTNIYVSAFYGSDFTGIDVPSGVSKIDHNVFYWCYYLKTLILRREESVCTLFDTSVFTLTPIEKGTGYIYVPSALLEQYKTTKPWSSFANQFRALEDYTVDGTTTGEFDFSKV